MTLGNSTTQVKHNDGLCSSLGVHGIPEHHLHIDFFYLAIKHSIVKSANTQSTSGLQVRISRMDWEPVKISCQLTLNGRYSPTITSVFIYSDGERVRFQVVLECMLQYQTVCAPTLQCVIDGQPRQMFQTRHCSS